MIIRIIEKLEIKITRLIVLIFVIASALVAINRHWQFSSFWYDFGIFDETVWQFSKFKLPVIPTKGNKVIWADHFNPSIISLVPLYWLTDQEEVIILAQIIFVGLSALFIYEIARSKIKNVYLRLSLLVSYLGYVGTQNALYTDVHNMVFAVLPLAMMFWAVYKKKWKIYWLSLIWLLGWQENAAGIGLGVGLWMILSKKQKKYGLITILLSVVWALVAVKIIMPYFQGGSYQYQPEWPKVWYEWVTRFVWPPVKFKTLVATLASFTFLPLFYLPLLPALGEQFLERFVLNQAATRWDWGMHYNAILIPLLFVSSVEVIVRLQKKLRLKSHIKCWMVGLAGLNLAIVFFIHQFYLPGPLGLAIRTKFYQQREQNSHYQDFLEKIPRDKGLIMTNNNLAAHLTHDQVVLLNKKYAQINPKVVAIYIASDQNENNFFPIKYVGAERLVEELMKDKDYQLIYVKPIEAGYIFVKK
jgi:uncharacterized membrane protein